MSKNRLNLVVDTLAYVVMLGLAATGLLLAYVLPPGTGGRHGGGRGALTFLGRSRHEWGDIHWYLAIALLVLVVLHIVLHWKWVTNTIGSLLRPASAKKAGAGVGGAVALLALGVVTAGVLAAPWLIKVQTSTATGGGRGRGKGRATCDDCAADCASAGVAQEHEPKPRGEHARGKHAEGEHAHGEHDIRGKNTLAEAAAAAGVPVARLITELKLPANTDPNERLGHLRREHGFIMEDVRALVERLRNAPKTKQ